MRSIRILTAAAALLSLTTVSFAQVKLGANQITFNKDVFEQNLSSAIGPNVMGYQYVLIKDGKIVSEKFGGNARAGDDGTLKVTATTPFNIGSLTKFMSGTALLNMFERPAATTESTYKKRGLKTNLDTPIWGEFPKVWLDVIPGPGQQGPTQRSITYRQLLQHRSGFDDQWNIGQKGGRPIIGFLKDGFLASQFDQREYCNMNFAMVGFLLPLIERHNLNYDLDLANNGKSQSAADDYVQDQLGNRMDAIMRERIWSKMTPKINPTCDGANVYKNTAAYSYSGPTDTKGAIGSSIDSTGHCTGTGGYFMSARDYANYIAHYAHTEVIVSKATRDMMITDTMNPADQLVWAAAMQDNWIADKFNLPNIAWSNGADARGSNTVLLRLPQNYYLVVFANSGNNSTNVMLRTSGVAAFKAAMAHNF